MLDLVRYLTDRVAWPDDPDACWLWKLSVGSHGYSQGWNGETVVLVHRLMWTLVFGDPGELTVDHLCRNRRCCNWRHLRLLSNVVNATDNGQGRKTHCPSGHAYDEVNTHVDAKGWRRCRQCQRDRRARQRAVAA